MSAIHAALDAATVLEHQSVPGGERPRAGGCASLTGVPPSVK
jgi:hypothetical protein